MAVVEKGNVNRLQVTVVQIISRIWETVLVEAQRWYALIIRNHWLSGRRRRVEEEKKQNPT